MSDEAANTSPYVSQNRRIVKKKRPAGGPSRDRWILSYADFITLLFAFFVAMYSIAIQHQGDDVKMAETLNGVFEAVQKSVKPISIGTPIANQSAEQAAVDAKVVPSEPTSHDDAKTSTVPITMYQLLNQSVNQQFQSLSESGDLVVTESKNWVNLELSSGLLFGEGDYQLTNEAVAVLMVVSSILKAYPSPVLVVGNTDDLPVTSKRLISNWHLSSLRASSVVDELVYQGVKPNLVAPLGFSSEHPKVSGTTKADRRENRRVTIRISKGKADNLYDYLFQ